MYDQSQKQYDALKEVYLSYNFPSEFSNEISDRIKLIIEIQKKDGSSEPEVLNILKAIYDDAPFDLSFEVLDQIEEALKS